MSPPDQAVSARKQPVVPKRGPFVLKTLLEGVPLSADGEDEDVAINCVEFFGMLSASHRQLNPGVSLRLCLRLRTNSA